jgi:riboflavin kinase/FMN adenylyltransferase
MQILGLAQLTSRPAASVVTVGNFDGVHCGHQALISEVVRHARERSATDRKSVV